MVGLSTLVFAIFFLFFLLLLVGYNQPFACSLHDSLECMTSLTEASVLVFGLILAFNSKVLEMGPPQSSPRNALVTAQLALFATNSTQTMLHTEGASGMYSFYWIAPVTCILLAVTAASIVVVAIADLGAHIYGVQLKSLRTRTNCLLSPTLFNVSRHEPL
ncbi:hypothetical protein OAO87_02450 [bacterium]|nr:hypothetical protein [bacterium]